jgi:hypothetical protein
MNSSENQIFEGLRHISKDDVLRMKNKEYAFKADMTGQNITYIYVEKNDVFISLDERLFFKFLKDNRKLRLNYSNISYLLLNNVIPYPYSIYENVYLLSIGDFVKLKASKQWN